MSRNISIAMANAIATPSIISTSKCAQSTAVFISNQLLHSECSSTTDNRKKNTTLRFV